MLDFFTILLLDVTAIEVTFYLTHSLDMQGLFFSEIILLLNVPARSILSSATSKWLLIFGRLTEVPNPD